MSKYILFVVEGERKEPRFLEHLFTLMRTYSNYKILSYKTNIHKMLDGMFIGESIDDDLDFLEYLRSIKEAESEILNNDFSDIFLIFDMDPQDQKFDRNRLSKAAEYFNDSTENGKLYINYPMMESYRHIPNLDDLSYLDVEVRSDDLHRYKEIAAKEGSPILSDISKIDEVMMIKMIVLNLRKANMVLNADKSIPGLGVYKDITQSALLFRELNVFENMGKLPVINTCLFNSIDYNADRFYNKLDEMIIGGIIRNTTLR